MNILDVRNLIVDKLEEEKLEILGAGCMLDGSQADISLNVDNQEYEILITPKERRPD